MWVPAELKDPILLHAPTRKSVGYFGAVRLRDGKLLTRQEGKVFDAQTFWQFLKQLRQVTRPFRAKSRCDQRQRQIPSRTPAQELA